MPSTRYSPADVTALVVAGGKATRFSGVDKRELVVGGRTIFERQCEVLAPRVAEVIVSARHPVPGYRVVSDALPDGGPLAGIAAGLAAARTPWLLVVAGDMPYLAGALLDALLAAPGAEHDGAGIRIGGWPEPLLCVLRVATCRSVVDARLARGELKASRLLTDAGLSVAWLDESAVRAVDPDLRSLANINAPEDL